MTVMTGWIPFKRKNIESEIWSEPFTLRLFILLCCRAVVKEYVLVNEVKVQKGQYLRSFSLLAEDMMYVQNGNMKIPAKSTIKRSVDRLVKFGYITTEETRLGTLFTILDADDEHQDFFCDENGATGEILPENREKTAELQQEELKKEKKDKKDLKEIVKEPKKDYSGKTVEKESSKSEVVTRKFISLRNSGFRISAKEQCAIERVCEGNVDSQQLVKWMEEVHAAYKKRNRHGSIKSFLYYEKALMQKMKNVKQSSNIPAAVSVLLNETNDLLSQMEEWKREGEKRLAKGSDWKPIFSKTVCG
ncbi:DNA helicase [Bacillus salacetis]|uniref:DNA helicase n=1 Tax=Bacillus salacetis TaxID=2315464 RepID=UPI003BA29563